MVDKKLAKGAAVASVVRRFGERQPHQARRRHGAVEAGQRHRVVEGLEPLPRLADLPRHRLVELGLGARIGAVAELVLEPHQAHAVAPAVGQQTRHEEARQAIERLGEQQEGVAGRRRQEPLVPGQPPHAVAGLDRLGVDGAEIAATLLLGQPDADGNAGFVGHRPGGKSYLRLRMSGSQRSVSDVL